MLEALDRAEGDNAGKLAGAVLTFTDVTEVKLARRDHSQLAAIVHSSDEAIVSLDLEGVVQSWNPGAERLFGWSGEEILGRPAAVLAQARPTSSRCGTLVVSAPPSAARKTPSAKTLVKSHF